MGELAGRWPTSAPSTHYPPLKPPVVVCLVNRRVFSKVKIEEAQDWSLHTELVEGRPSCWYPPWALFLSVAIYVDWAISSRVTTTSSSKAFFSPCSTYDHRSHTSFPPQPHPQHIPLLDNLRHFAVIFNLWHQNGKMLLLCPLPLIPFFYIYLRSIGKKPNDDALNIEEWSEINPHHRGNKNHTHVQSILPSEIRPSFWIGNQNEDSGEGIDGCH